MRFVLPKVEYIKQDSGVNGIYEAIERAGKICTNSPLKGGDIAKKFTDRMVSSVPMHGRPLEFGTVYLKFRWWQIYSILKFLINPYSKMGKWGYITSNYRVLVDNRWTKYVDENNKNFYSSPTKYHKKRHTIKWTISRVTADSFRTHCTLSSLMMSTRFCNYSIDKFGNEIIYVLPIWAQKIANSDVIVDSRNSENFISDDYINELYISNDNFKHYHDSLKCSEENYMYLTYGENADKIKAEDARGVLPLDVKTEFIQCGFESDWDHFFDLRIESHAHPEAQLVSRIAKKLIDRRRKTCL